MRLIKKCFYFSNKQASAHKDVERTFGILHGRWYILQQPARAYKVKAIQRIMYTCIILHNMIVEDNGYRIAENVEVYEPVVNMQLVGSIGATRIREGRRNYTIEVQEGLRFNLVEHLWAIRESE
ncbi:uncharacterized protein [Rutidosis leptorrhynchoides]|uniref:uncharacterized protein n=1 Tax=Rutidosis leptorrhynchoides TaxID=125765 RepID=UPI003A9A10C4